MQCVNQYRRRRLSITCYWREEKWREAWLSAWRLNQFWRNMREEERKWRPLFLTISVLKKLSIISTWNVEKKAISKAEEDLGSLKYSSCILKLSWNEERSPKASVASALYLSAKKYLWRNIYSIEGKWLKLRKFNRRENGKSVQCLFHYEKVFIIFYAERETILMKWEAGNDIWK